MSSRREETELWSFAEETVSAFCKSNWSHVLVFDRLNLYLSFCASHIETSKKESQITQTEIVCSTWRKANFTQKDRDCFHRPSLYIYYYTLFPSLNVLHFFCVFPLLILYSIQKISIMGCFLRLPFFFLKFLQTNFKRKP